MFGPKAQRKKARIDVGTFDELSKLGAAAAEKAEAAGDAVEESAGSISCFSSHSIQIRSLCIRRTWRIDISIC